jgi:hypothetical protein
LCDAIDALLSREVWFSIAKKEFSSNMAVDRIEFLIGGWTKHLTYSLPFVVGLLQFLVMWVFPQAHFTHGS